ncbi:MAG: YceI family protein [Cyclobacteriaceae bacterium]
MNTLKYYSLIVFSVFLVASCAQKPESDEAEVSAAEEVQEVSDAASNYAIQATESELSWYGFKPTGQHNGTIAIEDGTISVENDQIVGGTITFDMNEIEVLDLEGEDKQKLTGHLKSEDFFAVEQYPTAKFEITKVEEYNSDAEASDSEDENMALEVNEEEVSKYKLENPTHAITGNLTMRDTTLSITIPARVNMSEDQITAESKFNIDRTNWNVSYNDEGDPVRVAQDKFIYNTVNLGFDIVAEKQSQNPQAQSEAKTEGEDS